MEEKVLQEFRASKTTYAIALLVSMSIYLLVVVAFLCLFMQSHLSQKSLEGLLALTIVLFGYLILTYSKHKVSMYEGGIEGPGISRFPLGRTFISYDNIDGIDFEKRGPLGKLMRGCWIKSRDGNIIILFGFCDQDIKGILTLIEQRKSGLHELG